MPFISINPATGQEIARHPQHTARKTNDVLAAAHQGFLEWRDVSVKVRARHLTSIAATLRAHKEPLATLITAEVGKTLFMSRLEVEKCAACCDFYAANADRMLRPHRPRGAPKQARVVYAPLGVVLAIMPWNYPLWQLFRAAAPAWMAGNTVLHKPAANTAGSALALEHILTAARIPPGLLGTLLVSTAAIPAIVQDRRICGVTFTGGSATGRKVAALAGAALKPSVLELGGNDPYIILADADLDHAAETCARARLMNAGQSCIGAKRIIVVESVRSAFEHKFLVRMAARKMGPPTEADVDFGPLALAKQRKRLHSQVRQSIRHGARLLLGGTLPEGKGYYYPATVLADVAPGMPAYDEELFGPVAAIVSAKNEAHAIQVANDTPYGLGAAVFTQRYKHGLHIATRQLEVGMAFINDYVRSDLTLPFGGIKQSGHGRELGAFGLLNFANIKTVWAPERSGPLRSK